MIRLSIFPAQAGIRYRIIAKENLSFQFSYTAICEGGRIIYGTISGNAADDSEEIWREIPVAYHVIFVGVSNLEMGGDTKPAAGTRHAKIQSFQESSLTGRYTGYLSEYDSYLSRSGQYDPYILDLANRVEFLSDLEDFIPLQKTRHWHDPHINDSYLLRHYGYDPYLGPLGSNNF